MYLASTYLEMPALLQVETIFKDSLLGKALFVSHGGLQVFLQK